MCERGHLLKCMFIPVNWQNSHQGRAWPYLCPLCASSMKFKSLKKPTWEYSVVVIVVRHVPDFIIAKPQVAGPEHVSDDNPMKTKQLWDLVDY